jgi:hypothetical protein
MFSHAFGCLFSWAFRAFMPGSIPKKVLFSQMPTMPLEVIDGLETAAAVRLWRRGRHADVGEQLRMAAFWSRSSARCRLHRVARRRERHGFAPVGWGPGAKDGLKRHEGRRFWSRITVIRDQKQWLIIVINHCGLVTTTSSAFAARERNTLVSLPGSLPARARHWETLGITLVMSASGGACLRARHGAGRPAPP